jgi:hypothetical protein
VSSTLRQVQNLDFVLLLLLTNTALARFRPLVISAVSSLPLVRFSSVPTVLLLAVWFLLGLRAFCSAQFQFNPPVLLRFFFDCLGGSST